MCVSNEGALAASPRVCARMQDVNAPEVRLGLSVSDGSEHNITMSAKKFLVLHSGACCPASPCIFC
jgi:hypothetical protein